MITYDGYNLRYNAGLGTLEIDTGGQTWIPITIADLIDTDLTASTAVYASATKKLTSSTVTPTELAYLSGVTSALQTQLNALGPAASQTLTNKIINNQSLLNNYSVTGQSIGAASRTYITGSQIIVPTGKLQIGSQFVWTFNMTKTAAGTAASTVDVAIGTAGTTGDAAILSFTKPGGSGVADEAFCTVEVIVRGPLSASGVLVGEFTLIHNLAATGHALIPCVCVNTVSGSFDVTTTGLKVGLCLTSGASDAITIQQITAAAYNL